MRKDNDRLAICARAVFVLLTAALCFASVVPAGWLPRLFYSYHLEHFAAFYLVALAMTVARYRVKVRRLMGDAVVLASVLEGLRLFIPSHQLYVFEDWMADLGGVLAALAPVLAADFRRSFQSRPPSAET
jgi:hypothetical protein